MSALPLPPAPFFHLMLKYSIVYTSWPIRVNLWSFDSPVCRFTETFFNSRIRLRSKVTKYSCSSGISSPPGGPSVDASCNRWLLVFKLGVLSIFWPFLREYLRFLGVLSLDFVENVGVFEAKDEVDETVVSSILKSEKKNKNKLRNCEY